MRKDLYMFTHERMIAHAKEDKENQQSRGDFLIKRRGARK